MAELGRVVVHLEAACFAVGGTQLPERGEQAEYLGLSLSSQFSEPLQVTVRRETLSHMTEGGYRAQDRGSSRLANPGEQDGLQQLPARVVRVLVLDGAPDSSEPHREAMQAGPAPVQLPNLAF